MVLTASARSVVERKQTIGPKIIVKWKRIRVCTN